MKSLSGVGLGLGVVFGCLVFTLVLELYYLLWRKKRFTGREVEDDDYSNPTTELFYTFCCKSSSSSLSQTAALNPHSLVSHEPGTEFQIQSKKDFLLKPFGEDGIESEFSRLQNLSGPPRFLFPIAEETKEDLESDDGKGSKSKSLSDLLFTVDTPFLTPLTSPTLFFTPMDSSYSNQKFNPLFESASDAEFNKIRSSPPPKFKFLQDAEEKLRRKLMEEAEKQKTIHKYEEEEEQQQQQSYITIIVDHNKAIDLNRHSSNFQVLPLSSSPSAKPNPT